MYLLCFPACGSRDLQSGEVPVKHRWRRLTRRSLSADAKRKEWKEQKCQSVLIAIVSWSLSGSWLWTRSTFVVPVLLVLLLHLWGQRSPLVQYKHILVSASEKIYRCTGMKSKSAGLPTSHGPFVCIWIRRLQRSRRHLNTQVSMWVQVFVWSFIDTNQCVPSCV